MLMKYFTFTSICLLTFCMFLALSGTTDLPAENPEQINGPKQASQKPQDNDDEVKKIIKKQTSSASASLSTERPPKSLGHHRRIINLFGILLLAV